MIVGSLTSSFADVGCSISPININEVIKPAVLIVHIAGSEVALHRPRYSQMVYVPERYMEDFNA